MSKIPITILVLLTLVAAGKVQATIVEFHDDWIIQEGDEYEKVYVYDDATVGITGGKVRDLYANDSSIVNIFAGDVTWLYSSGSSTINIYGGEIDRALRIKDSGVANLFGGDGALEIAIFDSGILKIFGYGFEWQPIGEGSRTGLLSGDWLDGTPFSGMYLRNLPEPFPGSQVVLIPEPATIFLLAVGLKYYLYEKSRGAMRYNI